MGDSLRMTTGEMNRLGDRLRESVIINDADLAALQKLRREFDDALAAARATVATAIPEFRPTTRLKTVQTLVSKLKRETTMNLSQVQDIAGMRIVSDMTLPEQDEFGQRLLGLFHEAKVVDRRVRPSFGYRAFHIVAKVDGRLVEIQLRTRLQDRWAQIVERLADHWGRQIRYGGAPDAPTAPVGKQRRDEIAEMARRLSPLIEQCESASSIRGRRIQLESGDFCSAVTRVLTAFSRLEITEERH